MALFAGCVAQRTYVSCWHYNDYESAAKWFQYGEKGIAIKSTVECLKACFGDEKRNIRISKIKYIDYDTTPLNLTRTYLAKRKSFQYEQELRLFLTNGDLWDKLQLEEVAPRPAIEAMVQHVPKMAELFKLECPVGIEVEVNLEALIQQVLVSPTAADTLLDDVRATMKKYNLGSIEVMKSPLMDLPM